MRFLDYPINKDEQMKKIIQDTEEIISNLKDSTKITLKSYGVIENQGKNYTSIMYNLGQKLMNCGNRPGESLGNEQVSFI